MSFPHRVHSTVLILAPQTGWTPPSTEVGLDTSDLPDNPCSFPKGRQTEMGREQDKEAERDQASQTPAANSQGAWPQQGPRISSREHQGIATDEVLASK